MASSGTVVMAMAPTLVLTLALATSWLPSPFQPPAPPPAPVAGSPAPPPAPVAGSPTPEAADPSPAPFEVAALSWDVVASRPHDREAWTQGLQLDELGRLFESTGRRGRSTIREVDPASGAVLRMMKLPDEQFGEGLALVGDWLIQLTWKEGLANIWDRETFDLLGIHAYDSEGWGLCFDGERLVMSDGSDRLTFRDPATFAALGQVAVTSGGRSLGLLNELECVDGVVWANVWMSDLIVRIDPSTGRVDGVLDLAELADEQRRRGGDVLNGIAHDALAGTFLVTGKLWPELFEIRVGEPSQP